MGERVFTREDAKGLIRTTSEKVRIPSDFTVIASGALAGFSQVKDLTIPEGVKRIESHAFYTRSFKNTSNMEHLTIPSSLTQFDRWCFYDCKALKNIDLPEDFSEQLALELFCQCPTAVVRFGKKLIGAAKKKTIQQIMDESSGILSLGSASLLTIEPDGTLRIPQNYTIILPNAMRNLGSRGIKKVVIPSTIRLISPNAFSFLNSLEEVVIGAGSEFIDNCAFAGCRYLKKIMIPDSVKKIGVGAFMNLPSLESIRLPSDLEAISDETFSGCHALKKVHFGNRIQQIGAGAFAGCTSLRGMMLPESVKQIGNSAFWECSSLQRLYIPAGCEKLKQSALGSCPRLSTLYMPRIIRDANEQNRIFGDITAPNITFIDPGTPRPDWDLSQLPEEPDEFQVPETLFAKPDHAKKIQEEPKEYVPTFAGHPQQEQPQEPPVDAETVRKLEQMIVQMQGQMDRLAKASAAQIPQSEVHADSLQTITSDLEALRSDFDAAKSLRDSAATLQNLQKQIDTFSAMQSRMNEIAKLQEKVDAIA
ncbi:MAG TPA: hypothetical protein DCG49_12255, partial [Ruminococcus sp.]|nr:hypothetical protein [Ruminococcus sp.]